jgi:uncharacterized protein (DUF433 family)
MEFMTTSTRLDRIVMDPEIRFGKPTIRGTRITVADILGWLASGMSFEEVLEDYPHIVRDDILAALEYGASASDGRRVAS